MKKYKAVSIFFVFLISITYTLNGSQTKKKGRSGTCSVCEKFCKYLWEHENRSKCAKILKEKTLPKKILFLNPNTIKEADPVKRHKIQKPKIKIKDRIEKTKSSEEKPPIFILLAPATNLPASPLEKKEQETQPEQQQQIPLILPLPEEIEPIEEQNPFCNYEGFMNPEPYEGDEQGYGDVSFDLPRNLDFEGTLEIDPDNRFMELESPKTPNSLLGYFSGNICKNDLVMLEDF